MNLSMRGTSVVARLVSVVAFAIPCAAQQPGAGSATDALQKQVARDLGQQAPAVAQDVEAAGIDATKAEEFYAAGDYGGAAAAFGKRLESRPEDAALLYNLALSAWRAGNLARAEDAIDRYAAAPGGGRAELHQGMLGNIRYREAESLANAASGSPPPSPLAPRNQQAAAEPADPLPLLEQAIEKAKAARDAFAKASVSDVPPAGIARNAERALRLQKELEQKLEELKKQREQQKQDQKSDDPSDKDGKDKDDQKKDGEQQQKDPKDPSQDDPQQKDPKDEGKPDDESKQGEQQPKEPQQPKDDKDGKDGDPERQDRPEPKPSADDPSQKEPQSQEPKPSQDPSEQKPEPQPQPDQKEPQPKDGEQKPEPKPADGKDDAQQQAAAEKRSDAPGEQVDGAQISPEQRARLMEQLKGLDARMQEIRKATRSKGRPVERDW